MTDRDRPWPSPLLKGLVRVVYAGLLVWDFWPPTYWTVYVSAFATLVIWIFLEWVWLRSYRRWLEDRAARHFFEMAESGDLSSPCPMCGEEGIAFNELHHHIRLFHPDVDLESLRPKVLIEVQKPPLWVRLW